MRRPIGTIVVGIYALTAWFAVTRVAAGANLAVNGDLEDTGGTFQPDGNHLMSLQPGSTVIPGWSVINSEVVWGSNDNPFGIKTPNGTMLLDLTGYHDSAPYGGITQTINTVPGQWYEFTASVGMDIDDARFRGPVSVAMVAGSITNVFTYLVASSTGNVWLQFSIPYTATGTATPITITGASSTGGQFAGLDSVSFKSSSGAELLQNGNFEDTAGTFSPDANSAQSLQPGATTIPGWTATGAEIAWVSNKNPLGLKTPTGTLFLDLTGYHDHLPYGGVTQTVATVPGELYQLTLALGSDQDVSLYRGPMSATVTIGSATSTITTRVPTGNQWQDFELEFQAVSSQTPVQVIGTQAAGGSYLGLDSIRVVPSNKLRISNVLAANGKLSFTLPGGNYAVETRTDFGPKTWQPVNANLVGQPNGTVQVSVPVTSGERERFFRVRQI